ncbi:MAG: molybdopterin oxidoreductase [Sulfurimonas sp. RIFCSPHIGHO2_12_FULL_36_9]|uniref:molybdopterin-dependent oxidoreductase n=1 Tax=Sulfurimonas sp. RIFCSPLOWO2_12_36_12 TaxID=1802253 RepID=UPI0008BCD26F|nr:molybdopterin-dependent oxidoreductase [Sulfurimonas sp. RIFCSPLOWO2_12_36_12]OHD98181.1 MAG: molybdopterin oxidoreductase [Sulfurimonas sp. RIFCSPHIGHO2_12_FULL_36_9]OHD99948.1 MAG: molybdopterin oxidoreductase [Sulfurimonas sp. RIFCSPLOWO2_02_FULL_36_28]OHE00345.1 MAG: molybdopterin oxidoreductase [Sulfurimonas sp. RIFCSPLOWO2_12_36_12]OHE02685.1 MAG: molybdopterin oxidoreductase [Sulfurimonas sp. RIFCSPLOWO2_12_FULL_36_74]
MSNVTACPLDCYDACEIVYENGILKGLKSGYTQGFLCPHMNHYDKYETIQAPRYKNREISLEEALLKLKEMINSCEKDKVLHYRGSGNFALMQEVTDHFFASYGATLTDGTLCDGAGEAGIEEGRGSNKNMPITEVAKSDVVIFWGRNPHTTSSHILPLIKGKTIIVIDPIKTKIAKMADLHIQLKPHTDLFLAMLLSRFLHIENGCNEEFLDKYASEYEDYYELTQNIRIKAVLDQIDVSLGKLGNLLGLVKDKKVAIVCGVGIQKYSDGVDIMRAIDAFAAMLGLFGREGCGVSYLGSSRANIVSPFNKKSKKVSKVNTEFSDFETVFIQGANPLSQMPNSSRVKESISKVKNIVYFGLYENETSEAADLVIPAKSFLHKDDVRTSYSHNKISFMPKVADSEIGISEYDLSAYLCREFNIEIQNEEFYIKHFKNFAVQKIDGSWYVENRDEIPYKDGFDTDDGQFVFLDELDSKVDESQGMYLITSKSQTSLNSQFNRQESVFLHSSLGFNEGEFITVSSISGSVKLRVKHNDDLRKDCVLIYSGTKGVNNLTTHKHALSTKSAIFQENKVEISR